MTARTWFALVVALVGVVMQLVGNLTDAPGWVFWVGLGLTVGGFIVLLREARTR